MGSSARIKARPPAIVVVDISQLRWHNLSRLRIWESHQINMKIAWSKKWIKRAGIIFSPAFWYLPFGIFWVWFLFLYASKPKETMAGCLECPEAFVWAAFGVSLLAGFLAVCGKPTSLRCRIAGIALLSIFASALLMPAVFHYRFVFAVFFVALVAVGIAYFRAEVQKSAGNPLEAEKVKTRLFDFLKFLALILGAFFVAFMVDAIEYRGSWVDIRIAEYLGNLTNAGNLTSALKQPIVTRAMFSVLGLVAYTLIGGGAMAWEILLPRSKSE